jgi:L-asparaginase
MGELKAPVRRCYDALTVSRVWLAALPCFPNTPAHEKPRKLEEVLMIRLVRLAPAILVAVASFQAPALAADNARPLIRIVATGGTIANSPDGRMAVDTVLAQIPQIADHAQIEVTDYSRIGSSSISVQNWIDITLLVNRIFEEEPDVDGIVVTHGSNTAEETAYFLSLTLEHAKPVVVTASQRQQNTLGTEATRNLYDAIRVAADPDAAGKGVLLVVNERIHPARDANKRISVRVESWDSGDAGSLGVVDGDQVTFYNQPVYRHTITSDVHLADDVTESAQLPRVDILYAYAGADGALAEAAVAAGAKALVIAGFPTGAATPAQYETFNCLRDQGVHIIMSNRGDIGRINIPVNNDYISADNLTPQKARILAMVALARDPSAEFLADAMATH